MDRKIKVGLFAMTVIMAYMSQQVYANEEQKEEEKVGYEIHIPKPDGKNGYYISYPTVEVQITEEDTEVEYELLYPNGSMDQGICTKEQMKKEWNQLSMEGRYELKTREYIEETKEESWDQCIEWEVDTVAPLLEIQSHHIKGQWYKGKQIVIAAADDIGSGMARFYGKSGTKQSEGLNGNHLFLPIEQSSKNGAPVTAFIYAEDQAGNQSQMQVELWIDNEVPGIEWSGIEHYQTIAEKKEMVLASGDDNVWKSGIVEVEVEPFEGKKETKKWNEWKVEDGKHVFRWKPEKEGIYKIKACVEDAAGNQRIDYRQFILDEHAPEIESIEDIDGKIMQEFIWNRDLSKMIKDFTSTTYSMTLDGKIFHPGEKVQKEGKHILRIWAMDLAGNSVTKEAAFWIDRTPPVVYIKDQNGQEIDDGTIYDKEVEVIVDVEKKEDKIEKIEVNGIEQEKTKSIKLKEAKPYEITVDAIDLAGNREKKVVQFKIEEKKVPWKRTKEEPKVVQEEEQEKKLPLSVFLIAVGIGTVFLIWKKKK